MTGRTESQIMADPLVSLLWHHERLGVVKVTCACGWEADQASDNYWQYADHVADVVKTLLSSERAA